MLQAFLAWQQHLSVKRRLRAAAEFVTASMLNRLLRAAFNSWLAFRVRKRDGARLRGLADRVRGALQHKAARAAFSTWQASAREAARGRHVEQLADQARRAFLHRALRAAFSAWAEHTGRRQHARLTVLSRLPGAASSPHAVQSSPRLQHCPQALRLLRFLV